MMKLHYGLLHMHVMRSLLAPWLVLVASGCWSLDSSIAQEPALEKLAEDKPAEDKHAEEKPAEEKPAEKNVNVARPVPRDKDSVLDSEYKRAMVIDVRGPIFGSLKSYLFNRLDVAQRGKCDLVILRVTSPGGSLEDSMDIAKRLSETDWATTIAFIPDEAYSGAAILSLGCDRIYMRPRALIGDAGPIEMRNGAFQHVEAKMVSAIAVEMHQLAIAKKRPGALAEAMVDRKMVVHEATHKQTGERTFLTAKEIAEPRMQQDYDIGAAIPESGQDRFLTVAGSRALELKLSEGLFESENELLDKLTIEEVRQTKRTWVDQTVYVLNRPFVTGLLLLVGLIGLYVEFTVPGISVAGLLSLAAFALFFWSHALGGTSGWLEVMLFALGVSCLVMELFVVPGSAIFGLTGVAMIVLSLVMASQDFILPQTNIQWTTLRNNLLIVFGAMGVLMVALVVQLTFFDSIPGLNRLKLAAPDWSEAPMPTASGVAVSAGSGTPISAAIVGPYQPEIGQCGTADSVLRPAGKVRFGNQIVDVVTEGDFLDPGTEVEVIKREGNRIVVRQLRTLS